MVRRSRRRATITTVVSDVAAFTAQDLYDWRARVGLTGKQAAPALGIAENTYWGYEQGRRPIPAPIIRLARYIEKYGVLT